MTRVRLSIFLCLIFIQGAGRTAGQEKPQTAPPVEPKRAQVVGSVELKDYIELKARLISIEAQLTECQERRKRNPVARLLRAIFGK